MMVLKYHVQKLMHVAIVSDKPDKPEGKPKKPGAQKGHVGTTSRPKPTQLKTHTP